jgi:thiol-disulfide isomerase/thioredoxin
MNSNNTKYSMQDIYNFINNKDFAFVVIYSTWCGHCLEMKEELIKINKFKNTDNVLFLLDTQAPNELLDYLPHIYLYHNGVNTDKNIDSGNFINILRNM